MHKTAFSVTTAACSSHDCQKDPVLACTAESKSLLSATTLCHAGNASYCIFFSAGADWQLQISTESCSYSLQRGPLFGVSFVASMLITA